MKNVARVLWDPALSKTYEIQPLKADDKQYEKNELFYNYRRTY